MNDYKEYPVSIIRAQHGEQNPYFMMRRDTAQDKTLSFMARGMLSYLLSKPDNWKLQPKDLQQKCGRNRVYSTLNELIDAGYVIRWRAWDEDKKRIDHYLYEVYEVPVDVNSDLFPEKLYTANLHTGNGHITYSRDIRNTDKTKKEKDIAGKPQPSQASGAIPSIVNMLTRIGNGEVFTIDTIFLDAMFKSNLIMESNGKLTLTKRGEKIVQDNKLTRDGAANAVWKIDTYHVLDGTKRCIGCDGLFSEGEQMWINTDVFDTLYCDECYAKKINGAANADDLQSLDYLELGAMEATRDKPQSITAGKTLTDEQARVLDRIHRFSIAIDGSWALSYQSIIDSIDSSMLTTMSYSYGVFYDVTPAGRAALEAWKAAQTLTPQQLDAAIYGTRDKPVIPTAHIGALCEVPTQPEAVDDTPKSKKCTKCGKSRKIVNDGMCWECNGYLDRTEMLDEVYKRCFPGTAAKYSPTNIALMTKIVQEFGCRRMIDLRNYADWIALYYRHHKRNWHLTITSLGKPDMWGAFMAEMATQPPYIEAPLFAEPDDKPIPEQLEAAGNISLEQLEELERKAIAHFTLQDIDTEGMEIDDFPDTL